MTSDNPKNRKEDHAAVASGTLVSITPSKGKTKCARSYRATYRHLPPASPPRETFTSVLARILRAHDL